MGRRQLERVYGLRLPPPARQEHPLRQAKTTCTIFSRLGRSLLDGAYVLCCCNQLQGCAALDVCRPPTAVELLRAFAYARGWVAASGLPDETRAGRRILKDYVDGKILHCKAPPGASQAILDLAAAAGRNQAPDMPVRGGAGDEWAGLASARCGGQHSLEADAVGGAVQPAVAAHAGMSGASDGEPCVASALDEGDVLLIKDLTLGTKTAKPARPTYKVRTSDSRFKGCEASTCLPDFVWHPSLAAVPQEAAHHQGPPRAGERRPGRSVRRRGGRAGQARRHCAQQLDLMQTYLCQM